MGAPTCTVNGSSTAGGVNVASGTTATIQLVDLSATTWAVSCTSTDDSNTAPALSINQTTKTATFTTGAFGSAYILTSTTEAGSTSFAIYVLAANGRRVLAYQETTHGNATTGWTGTVNTALRTRAGVATYTFPSDANQTLPASAYGCRVLRIAGTLTATRTVTLPLSGDDLWFAVHNTTAQSVTFISATGTGVTVPTATKTTIYTDGTNWY